MTTYQAKVKISDVVYTIDWDSNDKVSIPTEFEAVVTSPDLVQVLNIFRTLRLWMDSASKQEIRITRSE